jgi:hypothetical protein
MGIFDWLFGNRDCCVGDEHLKAAVERVIEGTDPRLKAISDVRVRLAPAVAQVLDSAQKRVAPLPPCVEMTPKTWGQSPLLRAMFVRPVEVSNTLAQSQDLRNFLDSSPALAMETVFCVVAATRVERTVFGAALEGDLLRQDIAQKTVGFCDFRLAGFARTEKLLRTRLEERVLEGLLLAALRDLSSNKERSEPLERAPQLLLTRLRLFEQSGAGLAAMLDGHAHEAGEIDRLRRALAKNESELMEIKANGSDFEALFGPVIDALHHAESGIQMQQVSLRLNSMNVVVGEEVADAAAIEFFEFSTAHPDRPQRVAFLASFPRHAVVEQRIDFDAALQTL